jgi:hypothetical protein
MDVLQFMKEVNRQSLELTRDALAVRQGSRSVELMAKLKRQLKGQILLERDYLYPEVAAATPASGNLLTRLETSLNSLEGRVNQWLAASSADDNRYLTGLHDALGSHIGLQESKLMPQIRQALSTEEREELSQVFQDAYEDYLSSEPIGCAV